jgi:hypothetical protein
MIYQDDPFFACYAGASDHPHYLDCHNCKNAKFGCEYGDSILKRDALQKALEESNKMLESLRPNPDPRRFPDNADHQQYLVKKAERDYKELQESLKKLNLPSRLKLDPKRLP